MNMIIGGAWQGKLACAKEQYPDLCWVDGKAAGQEEVFAAGGIFDFQELIRRLLQEGKDPLEFGRELFRTNPSIVIVTCEVGSGIVPLDAFERQYREAVGRTCILLASFSENVTRVICGVPVSIKGGRADGRAD